MKHTTIPTCAAAALILICGCAAPCPRDIAASHVEQDGCYFLVCDETPLQQHVSATLDAAAGNAIRSGKLAENHTALQLMKLRLAYESGGLTALKAYAASSVAVNAPKDSSRALFRNREFWYVDSAASGLLPSLLPRRNLPFSESFLHMASSPRTLAAGCFPSAPAKAAAFLRHFLPNLPEVAPAESESEQFCEYLLFLHPGQPGKAPELNFYCAVPDERGTFYSALSEWLESEGIGWNNGEMTSFLPRKNGEDNFLLYRDAGRTIVTSGNATASKLAELAKSHEKNRLFLPPENLACGIGFFYLDGTAYSHLAKLLQIVAPKANLIFPLSFDLARFGSCTVFTRTPDGVASLASSEADFNTSSVIRSMFPLLLSGEYALGENIRRQTRMDMDSKRGELCRAALKRLSSRFDAYAQKHDGKFPAQNGADGIREVVSGIPPRELANYFCPGAKAKIETPADLKKENTPYLYFGGFSRTDNPDFPLVVDGVGNHAGKINVLFVDGRIREFSVEHPASAKHIVSFLHTVCHYPIPNFLLLLQKAAEL